MKSSLKKSALVGLVATLILTSGLFASDNTPCKCDGAMKNSTNNSGYMSEERPGGSENEKDTKEGDRKEAKECCASGSCSR